MDGLLAATDARDWTAIVLLAAVGGVVAIAVLGGARWGRHPVALGAAFVSLAWLALLALGLLAGAALEDDSGTVALMAVIAAVAAYGAIVSRALLLKKDSSRWLPAPLRRVPEGRAPEPVPGAIARPSRPERYELYDDIVIATDRFRELGVTRGTEGVVFGIGEDDTYEIAVASGTGEPTRFTARVDELAPFVRADPELEPESV